MSNEILIDGDVVIKICSYQLSNEFISVLGCISKNLAILAVTRFTIRSRIARANRLTDPIGATRAMVNILSQLGTLEPSEDEIDLAADLEQRAIELSVELDSGESQLFAILLKRNFKLLITGDKRAICALDLIAPPTEGQRLACFEQLIATLVTRYDYLDIRARICGEPKTDRAITACFSCSSTPDIANTLSGLRSYVNDLKIKARRLLIPTFDLSSMIS